MNEKPLLEFLQNNTIPYRLFEHQPVFTVDEIAVVTQVDGIPSSEELPGAHFKTLFLKDKNYRFFLVSVTEEKRVDLKALSSVLGCGRFSFGKPAELLELLKLTPGAVTPYGLLFDEHNKLTFVLDEDALNHSHVGFHPLRNDMTVVTTTPDFLACIEKMGYKPHVVSIPTKGVSQ